MKTNKDRETAIKLKQEGKSYGEIAKELGRSKNTIKSWIRRNSIIQNKQAEPKIKKLKKEILIKRGYEKRIKQLEMQVEILKDFIYEAERRDIQN